MKFATLTLTLVGTLLLGMPDISLAGRGLLDSKCSCPTQKGAAQKGATQKSGSVQKGCGTPNCTQKGRVAQKGRVIQKGHVAQKGCGKAGCGSKGHSCRICIPNVLPAVLHGIDHALNTVFQCRSCGSSKGHKGASQKGSCACGSSAKDYPLPSNPFVDDDDELAAPPIPDSDDAAQNQTPWKRPQPVRYRHEPTVAKRKVMATNAARKPEPRTLPVHRAEPILKQTNSTVKSAPVRKASNQTKSGLRIPKNPLRGA